MMARDAARCPYCDAWLGFGHKPSCPRYKPLDLDHSGVVDAPDEEAELRAVLDQLARTEAHAEALRTERDRLTSHDPNQTARWLLRKCDQAMRHLREAEDFARMQMPAWPTAERIRAVHEKLTEDVLNGSTKRPTPREQLRGFRDEVEGLGDWGGPHGDGPCNCADCLLKATMA